MSMTLEQLADNIRDQLNSESGTHSLKEAGVADKLCALVSAACDDQAFVKQHLTTRKPGENVREVLYEDSALGFCICAHVYDLPAIGEPHDHGPSWAIYGQAEGETEMSDWNIVKTDSDSGKLFVEKSQTYTLKPGDAHLYDIGDIHAPVREEPVKLLRIEGLNLDNIARSQIAVN